MGHYQYCRYVAARNLATTVFEVKVIEVIKINTFWTQSRQIVMADDY